LRDKKTLLTQYLSMSSDFKEELEELGKRIKQIRKHRKLKLLDLELLCGIQDSKLSRYERGLENVEYHTLFKLAKALQVEIKDFADYNGPLPDSISIKKTTRKKN